VGNEPKPKIPRDLFVIDEAVRAEYYYIEAEDTCFYIWERMSHLWSSGQRPDYTQYPVNQLISNLQILPSFKNLYPKRHYWKELAVKYAANALAALIPDDWRKLDLTFVPVPPSKPADDPEYDVRLLTTLKAVRPKLKDVRPLVVLDGESFDSKQKGLHPRDRAEHYSIDEDFADPEPEIIMLFDDILTTGCHFKAMEIVLKERFPDVAIYGLFLARSVRPTEEDDTLSF
jgi:hypothetical protein